MHFLKSFTCSAVLQVLFRALKYLNRRDSRIRAGFLAYEENYTFRIRAGMRKKDPCLTFCVKSGLLIKLENTVPAQLEITFKSISDAFLVFTGQLGIGMAYAEHRFYMRGNPNEAMGLVSCLELAEAYLFPRILSRRLMLSVPEKEFSPLFVYAGLLCPEPLSLRKECYR